MIYNQLRPVAKWGKKTCKLLRLNKTGNRLTFQTHTHMHSDSPWLGCFLRGSTLHEVISICFVDINFKFIAVVKSDCWTKSIINWVNGLREFYVNFLNGYSQSVSNHLPSTPPSLSSHPPDTHTPHHLFQKHNMKADSYDGIWEFVWRGLSELSHWAETIF